MSTIQIVLEEELLAEAGALVARDGGDLSDLVRKLLREQLHRVKMEELEEQERLGYERTPDTLDDWVGWEKIAAWPED